jgi:hypothetical protein
MNNPHPPDSETEAMIVFRWLLEWYNKEAFCTLVEWYKLRTLEVQEGRKDIMIVVAAWVTVSC